MTAEQRTGALVRITAGLLASGSYRSSHGLYEVVTDAAAVLADIEKQAAIHEAVEAATIKPEPNDR